ncbi:MAG: Kazal-type serine protease inhibitor [Bacteroidota bacterium]|nr:Kazal-type serine protease inhibitor [Bacteroidota bacterium]
MVRTFFKLFVFFGLNLLGVQKQALAQCIDPLGVNPSASCPTDYVPVCGCDQVTYRNQCVAQYRNGVLTFIEGPCSGFEFDLFPSFVSQNDVLRVTFVQNTGMPANFFIIDSFGKLVMQRTLPARDQFNDPFVFDLPEIIDLRQGTYIVMIYNAKGTYRYKKFVRF